MGKLTHTVSGPVASFRSADKASIESLKCYFEPVQEGTGDPSPTNVRPITGWTGLAIGKSDAKRIKFINFASATITGGTAALNSDGSLTINGSGESSFNIYCDIEPFTVTEEQNVFFLGSSIDLPDDANKISFRFLDAEGATILNCLPLGAESYGDAIAAFTIPSGGAFTSQRVRITVVRTITDITISPSVGCFEDTDIYPATFPALGKNLFNLPIEQGAINFTSGLDQDNTARIRTVGYFPVTRGLSYTISAVGPDEVGVVGYDDANTRKSSVSFVSLPLTITISNSANYSKIRLAFRYSSGEDITPSDISNIQIEIGASATSYEPYTNTIYGGYIDLISGQLVATYKYVLLNDSSKWIEDTYSGSVYYYYDDEFTDRAGIDITNNIYMCSIAPTSDNPSTIGVLTEWYARWFLKGSCVATLRWKNADPLCTLSELKQLATENKVSICYELATPITYQLTPMQLKTLLDSNNIWSDANGNTEVKYEVFDRMGKQRILLNTPHIATATGNVAHFDTDMHSKLESCEIEFLPVQEGTGDPSPSNIRMISGWSNLNTYVTGKNMLPSIGGTLVHVNSGSPGLVTHNQNDGSVTLKNGANDGGFKMHLRENETVTFSFALNYTPQNAFIRQRIFRIKASGSSERVANTIIDSNYASTTYTADQDADYVFIFYAQDYENEAPNGELVFSNWQVEYGSIATTYDPYKGQTIPVTLSNNVVLGGTLDLTTGVLKIEWGGINDAWKNWGTASTYENNVRKRLGIANIVINDAEHSMCNCTNVYLKSGAGDDDTVRYYINVGTTSVFFVVLPKTFDENTYVQVMAKFETPVIRQLTPQQLQAFKEANNIWSNANGSITVKYWTH